MKFYLDCCCLNRLFDDHASRRIRLEAEAVAGLLERAQLGLDSMVSSSFLEFEISRISDADRRVGVTKLLALSDLSGRGS